MKIEIKSKSLKEIIKKCEALGWDVNDVKIDTDMWEDVRKPGEHFVKLFIRMPIRKLKKNEDRKKS